MTSLIKRAKGIDTFNPKQTHLINVIWRLTHL